MLSHRENLVQSRSEGEQDTENHTDSSIDGVNEGFQQRKRSVDAKSVITPFHQSLKGANSMASNQVMGSVHANQKLPYGKSLKKTVVINTDKNDI